MQQRPPQQPPQQPNPIIQWFNSLPIITRTLFGATVGCTLLGSFLISPYTMILYWPKIFKELQIWRLASCFFVSKLGLNWAINLYFLYRHSLDLERDTFAGRTADYSYFVLLVMSFCLAGGYVMKFAVLGESLTLAIVYLWAQYHPEMVVNFMFGMRFKALYLPWVLVGWDLLMTGGLPLSKIMGIIAGHGYYYLDTIYPAASGRRLINTPSFLRRYFYNDGPRQGGFSGSGAYTAGGARPSEGAQGRTSWGSGRRLGD
ncbi:Der1-like family-domain-containing protein [Paraphysoderma sedebokerense]|nr:Der1-like family-domain-containing protein [Paraphysoderma sedebokerense]